MADKRNYGGGHSSDRDPRSGRGDRRSHSGGGKSWGDSSKKGDRDSKSRGEWQKRGDSPRRGGKSWGDDPKKGNRDGKSRGDYKRSGQKGSQGRGRWNEDRSAKGRFDSKKQKPHESEYRSMDPNEPVIPAGVMANELDKEAQRSLSTLSGANQEIVARHLVVAGQLLEVDPESAYQHAQAAVKRAGRVDVVREAAALTAYASGRYEEALREVRAVRRMRGDSSLRAIEADCERGLGRPEKAVEIVENTDVSSLSLDDQVELMLVGAGARADLGQLDYSLMIVEQALEALPADADPMLYRRLMSLQAERLNDLGRVEEAESILSNMPDEPDLMEIVSLDVLLDGDVDKVRTDLRGSEQPLNKLFDGTLLDLDGVCYHGTKVQAGGPEALNLAEDEGMQVGFITNNASLLPENVADKLASMGYRAEANQVMTAAMDLIADLKDQLPEGSTVLVVGTDGLSKLVTDAGFIAVSENVDGVVAVVQGFGPEVGWASLTEAAYAINAGAQYYATNLDATLPTERGFALGNGALVSAVVKATKRRPIAAGKPRPDIFLRSAKSLHVENPIFVGDRLETDIAGAVAARMTSMHVLTGVHKAKDVILAPKVQRPSFVAIDLDGLNQVHPRPLHHRDGTWTCGVSQTARIKRDGTIEVNDIPLFENGQEVSIGLDTYRAIIAASWEIEDDRRRVRCPSIRVVDNDDPAGIITESNIPNDEIGSNAESNEASSEELVEVEVKVDNQRDESTGTGRI